MSFFSKLIGDLEVGLGSIFNGLQKIGVTPTIAHAMLLTFINAGLAQAEAPLIHKLVANYKQPAIVTSLIAAAKSIPNLPVDVMTMLDDLPALAAAAAEDPTTGLPKFMATITDIETKLGL